MNTAIIDRLIEAADRHQVADEYRYGTYEWSDGACAIGCAAHDLILSGDLPPDHDPSDHTALANVTGIPEWALWLLDELFEQMPEGHTLWPGEFLRAARDCRDWDRAKASFLVRLLERIEPDDPTGSVAPVLALWRRVIDGESIQSLRNEFVAVEVAAWAAAEAAEAAWVAAEPAAQAAWVAAAAARAAAKAAANAAAEHVAQRNDLLEAMRGN